MNHNNSTADRSCYNFPSSYISCPVFFIFLLESHRENIATLQVAYKVPREAMSVRSTETTRLLGTSPDQLSSIEIENSNHATVHRNKDNKRVLYACLLGFVAVASLFVWISMHSYDHFQSFSLEMNDGGSMRVYLEAEEEGVYLRIDSSEKNQGVVIATESIPWASGSSLTVVLGSHDCWKLKSTWSGKWLVMTEHGFHANTQKEHHATCFEAVSMPLNDFPSSRNEMTANDKLLSFRVTDTNVWLTLSQDAVPSDFTGFKPKYALTTTTATTDITVFRVHMVDLLKGVNLGIMGSKSLMVVSLYN